MGDTGHYRNIFEVFQHDFLYFISLYISKSTVAVTTACVTQSGRSHPAGLDNATCKIKSLIRHKFTTFF